MTELRRFLSTDANTTSREVTLAHRTLFDLKIAAARRGYDLRAFAPDVDRDGYDIVLEDGDNLVRLQLKATLDEGASATNVHKALLRPRLHSCRTLGFEQSPYGVGLGGGILQTVADVSENDVVLRYRYTDAHILVAFEWGVVDGPRSDARNRIMGELREGIGSERVSLTPSMMLVPKSTDALLALMGLHSTVSSGWPNVLEQIGTETRGNGPRDSDDVPHLVRAAFDELKELVVLPD